MNLNKLTIAKAHKGFVKKEFSAVELTQETLKQIEKKDKEINAYLKVCNNSALESAKKIDEKIQAGEEISLLSGIPIAVKDNILVCDVKCSAGSKILENYIAPYSATVIKKLKKAGAVIIGKTNMDEFGMGSSTENSAFGSVKNPRDLERVSGGSSGGSAAAVASGECIAALGSDTGGSIRQPCSFCGVVGLKPTYGIVSRYGLIAYASSLDQIGPIAKTSEDVGIILDVIQGKDKKDSTSVVIDERNNLMDNIKNIKIGVPEEYFVQGIDAEVEKKVDNAINKFEKAGAKIVKVSLPHTQYALACYYIISTAEASSNLARYDGIKYGLSKKVKGLLQGYLETRQHGFGDEVRRRIMLGTYVLSAGYYDAYYVKAQKVRTLIKNDFLKAFKKVDVLMAPTSPTTAFKIGEKINNPVSMYLSDIYTISVNLAGLPAISIPCGLADRLPVGLQIIGNQFDDKKIINIAQIYENNFS
ncbi:Asp-tRNA(Asn)/Glu-tRNA(Gln) amidotransferase subunit GatA [Patescibacteria group bacterium]